MRELNGWAHVGGGARGGAPDPAPPRRSHDPEHFRDNLSLTVRPNTSNPIDDRLIWWRMVGKSAARPCLVASGFKTLNDSTLSAFLPLIVHTI